MTTPLPAAACAFPGCEKPAERGTGGGRPRLYCGDRAHTAQTAYRALRQEGGRVGAVPDDLDRPVTMARARAAVGADRLAELIPGLRAALADYTDALWVSVSPEAVEAQIEAVTTDAARQVAEAEAARAAANGARLAALDVAAQREADVATLAAQVGELVAERDAARGVVEELRDQVGALIAEVADGKSLAAAVVADRDERIAALVAEHETVVADLGDQLGRERDALAQARRSAQDAAAESGALLAEVERFQVEVEGLRGYLAQVERDYRVLQRERDQAETQMAAAQERVVEVRRDLDRAREDVDDARAGERAARADHVALAAQVATLVSRLGVPE